MHAVHKMTQACALLGCLGAFAALEIASARAQDVKERAVLTGHKLAAHLLVVSPDGKILASADGTEGLKLWDLVKNKELRTLTPKGTRVRSVAFTPSGKNLVVSSLEVTLWDVAKGTQLKSSFKPKGFIDWPVACSKDGKTVYVGLPSPAFGKAEPTLLNWDLKTGKDSAKIKFTDSVDYLEESADGKTLILSTKPRGKPGQVVAVDLKTGAAKPIWTEKAASVLGRGPMVALAADNKTAAFGTRITIAGAEVHLGDLTTGKVEATLEPNHRVSCLALTPDGKTLLIGGVEDLAKPAVISFWDVATQKETSRMKDVHLGVIASMLVTPDGKTLVTGGSNRDLKGEIKVWDVPAGK
jgi:WD40 repeat protein